MSWIDYLRPPADERTPEKSRIEIPLFPLGSVLFPGGVLSLKVFEQRYLDMAAECLRRAGVAAQALDAIYLTGGSSALRPLRSALHAAFPDTPQVEGDLFGGVASGLAYTQG